MTPPGASLSGFAISPDRRALVYQATIEGRSQLWIRSLDSDTARPLDGTADGTRAVLVSGQPVDRFLHDRSVEADRPGWRTREDARQRARAEGRHMGRERDHPVRGRQCRIAATPCPQPAVTTPWPRASTGRGRPVTGIPHFLARTAAISCSTRLAPRGPRCVPGHTRFDRGAPSLRCGFGRGVRRARSGDVRPGRGALWMQRLDPATLRPVGEPVPVSTQVAVSGDLFGDVALCGDGARPDRLPGQRRDPAVQMVRSDRPVPRRRGRLLTTASPVAVRGCRPTDGPWCFAARSAATPTSGRSRRAGTCCRKLTSNAGQGLRRGVVTKRRPDDVHLRSNGRAQPLRDVAFGGSASADNTVARDPRAQEHRRLVGGWAIHSLRGPESNDWNRPLGPAALRRPKAHRRWRRRRPMSFAAASRPTADGWRTESSESGRSGNLRAIVSRPRSEDADFDRRRHGAGLAG